MKKDMIAMLYERVYARSQREKRIEALYDKHRSRERKGMRPVRAEGVRRERRAGVATEKRVREER